MFQKLLILFSFLAFTHSVPPTPSLTFSDFNSMKSSLKTLMDDFTNWNSIYHSQIEPRIVSTGSQLTNIDSNLKNLQERAHIWDAIQHHVSAWNEQLSTSDRKLDIMSKGQEKLIELEEKINVMTISLENKLDIIVKKLQDMEDHLQETNRKLDTQSQYSAGLFGEFAARGILSTLKIIERKLDKVQLTNEHVRHNLSLRNPTDTQQKMNIKCNTSPIEELLHDVSAKVDVLFDKSGGKCEENDMLEENYLDDTSEDDENKDEQDTKLLKKILKRFNQPCKHSNKILEHLSQDVKLLINNTARNFAIKTPDCPAPQDNSKYVKHLCSNIIDRLEASIVTSTNNINANIKNQTKTYENHVTTLCSFNRTISTQNTSTAFPYFHNPQGYENYTLSNKSKCDELSADHQNGVYIFNGDNKNNYNIRYCKIEGNDSWTVFQRRGNYEQLENFNQNWQRYKIGFGDLRNDFWFGNENLHQLSANPLVLRVELTDFDGKIVWAEFDHFQVLSEEENYKLLIEGYRGNVPDSLSTHNGSLFSTFDRTNDEAPECCPCANSYGGGWWFNNCFDANLNGVYYRQPHDNGYYRGIIWEKWMGNYSLRNTEMMVKERKLENRRQPEFAFLEDP